jgi:DNA-directed RNA polymerase subunit delta
MSNQYTLKIPADQAKEMPMVDLAFIVLKAANTPFYYRDLMTEIAKIKGFSDDQVMQVIAQLYTEINVDGRFACVGNNLWGLKRWYPIDNKADDAMGNAKRPRIINDEDDDEDDLFSEEEDTYVAEEDFDTFDRDGEELVVEEEEEEELFAEDELADGELDDTELEESDDELSEDLDEESDFEDDDLEDEEEEGDDVKK